MKKTRRSLAVIIPMYNEQHVASKCIDKVMKEIKNLSSVLLIVVNDGSTDNTTNILIEKVKQHQKLLVLTNKKNEGFGSATKVGVDQAVKLGFEWCLHMDSDLTNDPKYIKVFLKHLSSRFDCIKASRYIRGSKLYNVPFYRQIISTVGNAIASSFFKIGIKDCTNGFRAVKLEKLKGIHFKENSFAIILEELYELKKRKARFMEIPYTLTARTNSRSHFRYNAKIFYNYFKYVLKGTFLL